MRAAALILCSLLLAGCTTAPKLEAGVSRSEDVLAAYGQPRRIWPEADGGRTLEYSSQPMGRHCLMVRLDADGRVVSVEDGLSAASRARITPGMTPVQVSRILGTERSRVHFHLSDEDVWDWNIEADQGGYGMRFNVHFQAGRVVRTSQSMVLSNRRFPGMDD